MIGSSDVEPDIPSQSIEAAENGGYIYVDDEKMDWD
jgi:hypothetical protein